MEFIANVSIRFRQLGNPHSLTNEPSVTISAGDAFDPEARGIPADEVQRWLARGDICTPEQWAAEQERVQLARKSGGPVRYG